MSKRKTQEEFEKEVYDLVGNEYKVLGTYINANTKIKMKHNTCGCDFEIRPYSFLRGRRCAKCSGNMKKNQEQFEKEVFNLVGDEYKVLGEYKKTNTKIKMRHNTCGYEYEVIPNSFLRGHRCPKCAVKPRKTQEQFEKEVFDLVGNEYTVLGEYKKTNTKIKMRHNTCGYEYEVVPNSFLSGCRCPKCARKTKKTQEQFEKEVFDLVGSEYTVLGEYKSAQTKVKMKHNTCGYEYEVIPRNILNGKRCPKCFGNIRKTQEQFEKEVFDLIGNEYEVIGTYTNTETKILFCHNICGYEFEMKPNNFLNGNRCPRCNESKGEKAIYDFLKKAGITFKREYKISECKNKYPLPFDFAIFDSEGNIKSLIEYQGEQHYKKTDFFFKEDANFVNRIVNDCKKRAYCEYNNIPLLEISYTDFDKIEDILSNAIYP